MSNKQKDKKEYVAVGGQALMEGIMMRGPKGSAMALRLPDGSIDVEMKKFVSIRKKYKFFNIPVLRGVVSFIESMIFGYNCLMESAEKTSLDDLSADESDSKLDKWLSDHFGPKMMSVIGIVSMVLSLGISFLLFMYAPSKLFTFVNERLFDGGILKIRTLFEGIIRIIIFVTYMVVVSKMKEIHRVYMYHGAEHKSIFCFEAGLDLTVENVKKQIRFHPRCGTSFIFLSIIISIIISSVFALILPDFILQSTWRWVLIKLLILPLIMGVGFEFIQLAGKYQNRLTKALSAPGLWMQRITTAEPTDDIIEVGIAALKAALNGVPEKTVTDGQSANSEQAETEADSGESQPVDEN
ncbi:MAG: DUF1385 domain-containing protein [Clostridia bacterium]|nr:DUF1385 domain-containing protein [Clostridia bacterium]